MVATLGENSYTCLLTFWKRLVTALKQWYRIPSYINYHLKRRLLIASYVQPVIKLYKTVATIKVATIKL